VLRLSIPNVTPCFDHRDPRLGALTLDFMNSARILAFLVLVHEYRLLSRRSDSLREPVILVRLGDIHAQIPSLKDPLRP